MKPKSFRFTVKNSDFVKSIWSGRHSKCVEVARKPEGVAVRDSKSPDGGTLFFTNEEWEAFTHGVKSGEFNV